MNSEQTKLITNALVAYDLLPTKRITKKEQNTFARLNAQLKNTKQPSVTMLAHLIIKQIEDTSKLNPVLNETYTEFGKEILITPGYMGLSWEEITCREVRLRQQQQENIKELNLKLFELRESFNPLKQKNRDLQQDLNFEKNERERLREQLLSYDSDCESEEEEKEVINYDQLEVNATLQNKINQLASELVQNEEERNFLRNQVRQLTIELETHTPPEPS